MYHYVENVADPKDAMRQRLAVTPALFERQLQTLVAHHYRTFFVRDVPALLRGSGSTQRAVFLTFDDSHADFYTDAFPLLKKYHMKATIYAINDFLGRKDFLTEEQLKEIAASGLVEVGAHTLDHLDLRKLSAASAWRQIEGSKKGLERMIGGAVTTFAYPAGRYTDATLSLVKKAGFTAAVTTHGGFLQTTDGAFVLRRIRPGGLEGSKLVHALGG